MGEEEQLLITGLPDDIALDCIARVSHRFHPSIRLVSRRWRDLVASSSFCRHRERIGTAEDLVFVVQALVGTGETLSVSCGDAKDSGNPSAINLQLPVHAISMYTNADGSWHRLISPDPVPLFAQCVAVDGKILFLGGWDPATLEPVADVRIVDLATGEWRKGRPMSAARSFFACATLSRRVYVAGGHDAMKNALRTAEAYDLTADEWQTLQEMEEERDECRGVAVEGKFWVVSGYKTENQGRFDSSAEWYDPETGKWSREQGVWSEEGGAASCFSGAGGDGLWCVGRRGVSEYRKGSGWKEVGQAPGEIRSSCATATRGEEEVFVMGSVSADGDVDADERCCGWVVQMRSGRWRRLETPARFSGFGYSAAWARM